MLRFTCRRIPECRCTMRMNLSGAVKAAIRRGEKRVQGILVHMEPYTESPDR